MNYQVTVNNLQKGSIAKNIVISDLPFLKGWLWTELKMLLL